MHHMASRDDDLKPAALEHSLTEDATVFPPSGLGQVLATPLELSAACITEALRRCGYAAS
jgi:hypothetical protein